VRRYVVSHLNAKLQNWQWAWIYFFQEKSRNVHRIAGLPIKCNSFAESPNLVQQTGPYSPSLLISCSVTPAQVTFAHDAHHQCERGEPDRDDYLQQDSQVISNPLIPFFMGISYTTNRLMCRRRWGTSTRPRCHHMHGAVAFVKTLILIGISDHEIQVENRPRK
jgi:hypothetical protein